MVSLGGVCPFVPGLSLSCVQYLHLCCLLCIKQKNIHMYMNVCMYMAASHYCTCLSICLGMPRKKANG